MVGPLPDRPRIPFPPPLPFLVALILALALHIIVPLPAPWPEVMPVIGMAVSAAGLVLAASALSQMAKAGTPADPTRGATALVMQGPYGFTRNPIYFGFALAFLGFTFIARTLWGLVLTPVVFLIMTRFVIAAEEEYLLKRFGERYANYASRVRRWL